MTKYEDSRDLAEKMYNEGDLGALIFGYGLYAEDLPDDLPVPVREAITRLIWLKDDMDLAEGYLNEVLEREE